MDFLDAAYANVWGEGQGYWSLSAAVPNDNDSTSGRMRGDVYRTVEANHFEWTLEAPDTNRKLIRCEASGNITVTNHHSSRATHPF